MIGSLRTFLIIFYKHIRHPRLIARQRQKLGCMLASEKNRLHKILSDVGIRLGVLVSDIHGQAARSVSNTLIAGEPMAVVLDLAGRLRASRAELFESLQPEELSGAHLFVLPPATRLRQLQQHLLRDRPVAVYTEARGGLANLRPW